MGCIYKIINDVNDKVYIGETSRTVEKRWQEHRLNAISNPNTKLYKAMNEIGIEHFSIEVIEAGVELEELFKKEKYYIKKYDSFYNGYNSNDGHGHKSKNKISQTKISDEDIETIITLYESNKTIKEIGDITKLGSNRVKRVLNKTLLKNRNYR